MTSPLKKLPDKKLPDPIFPEVRLGRYLGLAIRKNQISVSEAEIQSALRNLIRQQAAAKPSDQPAQLGNRVEIDFNLKENGRDLEGGLSLNHPLILGQGSFAPGFEEQIVGMRPGEFKRFKIQIPVDHFQKNIAGKVIEAEVTLKQTVILAPPELNDDFARSLGKFSGLDELKTSLSQGLLMEKVAREKERVRAAILGQITQTAEVKAPKVLVEERLDFLVREFDEELHQKGLELGLYLAKIKKTQDELRKDWRPKAEVLARQNLVIKAIAREENIKVTDDEIVQELAILADHWTRDGLTQALGEVDPEGLKRKISEAILSEKVLAFLEENNTAA